jgi:hypothetical protein
VQLCTSSLVPRSRNPPFKQLSYKLLRLQPLVVDEGGGGCRYIHLIAARIGFRRSFADKSDTPCHSFEHFDCINDIIRHFLPEEVQGKQFEHAAVQARHGGSAVP